MSLLISKKNARRVGNDIDKVITVGGTTFVPIIKNFIENYFGREKICKNKKFTRNK